jgi:uncharacterized protein YndB with AHSA1/START domain
MARVQKSVYINAPLKDVYALAGDPSRWSLWFVGMTGPEEPVPPNEPGAVMELTFQAIGLRMPLRLHVEKVEIGEQRVQWQGRFEGGMSGQHVYTYTAEQGGTRVTVDEEFTTPNKMLSKIADTRLVERILEGGTEQRLENLRLLCEQGRAETSS